MKPPEGPVEKPRDDKEVFKELDTMYREKAAAMDSDEKQRFNDVRLVFSKMLQNKYRGVNLSQFRLHHLVNFSTITETDEPNIKALDLPGGDYEKFIRAIK